MGNFCAQCICGSVDDRKPKEAKGRDAIRNNSTSPPKTDIQRTNGTPTIPNDLRLSELQRKMEERLKQPLNYYYKMNHKSRGLCLIFNHETFLDPSLGIRKGTQVDRDRLQKTFTALEFDVRIHENPSESEIRAVLKKAAAMDHTDNDCLVVIVLSHGELVPYYDYHSGDESDTLLSHDLMSYVHSKDTMYPLQMIWKYFTDENCPSLTNKPRIFLVQACQGNKTDPGIIMVTKRSLETDSATDISDNIPMEKVKVVQQSMARRGMSIDETDGAPYEPVKIRPILPQKDFLIAYASLPGYFSFRNTFHGAWFIQSLCKELDQREEHYDFMKILTLTSQQVAYDFESHSMDQSLDLKKQIPHNNNVNEIAPVSQEKTHHQRVLNTFQSKPLFHYLFKYAFIL